MQTVSIVGLGLIGGSIGLGLKRWSNKDGKREDVLRIIGFDLELQAQNYAKKIKAVDRTEWSLPRAVEGADVVVLAVPPLAMRDVMETIAPSLNAGTVVCDVASTKVDVLAAADELLPKTVNFVGTHPMAGSHRGIEGASADLFDGATWCVVPSVTASESAVQTVLGLVNALEADPLFVDAHEHDGFVGGVSHLPFLLSIALTRSVSKDAGWRDMRHLSASGFRDVSRLAGGSAVMHRDICVTNRDNIVRWLGEAIDELYEMRQLIHENSEQSQQKLLDMFDDARDARAEWATTESSSGKLVQDTEGELTDISVGGQIQQMIFGNLFRRKPTMSDRDRR